jgi:hypothetical protein
MGSLIPRNAVASVATQGQREQPSGDAGARSRGGAARVVMVRVPRVAGRRPRQVEARATDRKFMRRQFAQHDRAGTAQLCHAHRIGRGDMVDQDLRVAGRWQPGDIDDVLDADRHAVQLAARPARHDLGLGSPGSSHRRLGIEPDKGMQRRIEPGDAI